MGQSFQGVVLSSEATIFVSPADRAIVEQHGISGINCSWNRLDEIPFGSMGKGRNQRILPLLYAANSVNYGKISCDEIINFHFHCFLIKCVIVMLRHNIHRSSYEIKYRRGYGSMPLHHRFSR